MFSSKNLNKKVPITLSQVDACDENNSFVVILKHKKQLRTELQMQPNIEWILIQCRSTILPSVWIVNMVIFCFLFVIISIIKQIFGLKRGVSGYESPFKW